MIHFRSHFFQFLPDSFRVLIHSQQTWMHFFTGHCLWGCFLICRKNGIMFVWVLILNFDSKSSEMSSGKPLGGLVETIRSLWSCSWDRERIFTVPDQTHTNIWQEDLSFLRVRWSHLHIPEWFFSFLPVHSVVWVSWWIFDIGEWRSVCSWLFNYFYKI